MASPGGGCLGEDRKPQGVNGGRPFPVPSASASRNVSPPPCVSCGHIQAGTSFTARFRALTSHALNPRFAHDSGLTCKMEKMAPT